MADIRQINIQGIDIGAALEIIEDEDILEAVMQTYCEDGDNKLRDMESALSSGDLGNYAVYVHALKSSSKSIGALELSEGFKALELAGKGGDSGYIKNNHESVIQEYKRVLGALREVFGDRLDNEEKFTQESAEPLLKAIRDKDAGECRFQLDELLGRNYSSYVRGSLEDISAAIDISDFDDAEMLLEDVLLTIEVSAL